MLAGREPDMDAEDQLQKSDYRQAALSGRVQQLQALVADSRASLAASWSDLSREAVYGLTREVRADRAALTAVLGARVRQEMHEIIILAELERQLVTVPAPAVPVASAAVASTTAVVEEDQADMSEAERTFSWSPRKERAAQLLADGQQTAAAIAGEVGVTDRQLRRWQAHPEFAARVGAGSR